MVPIHTWLAEAYVGAPMVRFVIWGGIPSKLGSQRLSQLEVCYLCLKGILLKGGQLAVLLEVVVYVFPLIQGKKSII